MSGLFDFLDSLSYSKKDISREDGLKDYESFFINNGFSQHLDTILIANEMNKRPFISKQMHHDYLLNSVRARKRYGKWVKKESLPEQLDIVMRYYDYSKEKAIEAMKVLTDEQIAMIESRMNKGGKT
jgi:hypothetical protein